MSATTHEVVRRYTDLPVSAVLDQLHSKLTKSHCVFSAPTGSGKTTLVPLALLAANPDSQSKIMMLEPRRIAARTSAKRMSAMLAEKVGATVGYRTRFESKISAQTRIEVVTEGILIKKLQHDPELAGVGLVIFDEFHERNLQSDLALALCLDLCELRDDLRLLVMSATLEAGHLCALLGDAPHIQAEGRTYPVTINHLPPREQRAPLFRQLCTGVLHAWDQGTGDILAFLPGAGEIHRCLELLRDRLPSARLLPLYGNLSHSEQDRIFHRDSGQRRIILATPIAETSLTIEGITTVVDSGWYRRPVYDPGSGLSRLATLRISKASAEQRAGRAGRMGPGTCYRLWDSTTQHSLLDQTPSEIIQADLSSLVLELALWGVTDPRQLKWLDTPRESAWNSAVLLLTRLQLVDNRGGITPLGKSVAALPLHPRLGVILTHGKKHGCPHTASLLAAALTERDIFKGRERTADIEERVRALSEFGGCDSVLYGHIDRQLCRRLLMQVQDWLKKLSVRPEKHVAYAELGTLLAYGYPDRIAAMRPDSKYHYRLASGKGAELSPAEPLAGSPILVTPQVDARHGNGKIFMAAPVNLSDLHEHHPHLLSKVEKIYWHSSEKRVQATTELRLDKLILHSTPLTEPNAEQVAETFLKGIRQGGAESLPFSAASRELQSRVCFLNHRQPHEWPDFADSALMAELNWLAPYCHHMHAIHQLTELDLKTILLSRLSRDQQLQLDQLAPTHITVPSGSRIRLTYAPVEPPILAVRLQELFGLDQTPAICRGKVPVLLHLLSPARRPMQVTSDLASFWRTTYPEVRKELAGRYPKHYWPKDPLDAQATAVTKKKMQASQK